MKNKPSNLEIIPSHQYDTRVIQPIRDKEKNSQDPIKKKELKEEIKNMEKTVLVTAVNSALPVQSVAPKKRSCVL
jgi:hypothetical protein